MSTPQTLEPSSTPTAAVVVTHEVADYAVWKKAFDGDAGSRASAGIVAAHVNRSVDNPNLLTVFLAAKDMASLRAFASSEALKKTMHEAGVVGAPQIAFVTPVEDSTAKDKPLAGAIVRHQVADYAAWKKAFDGDGAARAKAGIVGHAVNRSVDNPNVVVAYIQAESIDRLRAFTASPELKDVMMKAGVQGQPQIAFVQGQSWGS